MKIFISWSGHMSLFAAEALREWLPLVINAIDPWLSSSDIQPGARWSPEIAQQLETTRFGIICLTSENLNSPWLHFEAGALSKSVGHSRVIPYLLNLKPTDIQGPMAQFQAVEYGESGSKRLVGAINSAILSGGERGLDQKLLDQVFSQWWPKLQGRLRKLPPEETTTVKRTEREILEEILLLIRSLNQKQYTIPTTELFDASVINSMLDAYFQRARTNSGSRWSNEVIKPPKFSPEDLENMEPRELSAILHYFYVMSLGTPSGEKSNPK